MATIVNSLSLEQTRAMLYAVRSTSHPSALDNALLISILLVGSKARRWTWNDALADVLFLPMGVYQALHTFAASKKLSIFPFNHAGFTKAHWVGEGRLQESIFTASISRSLTPALTPALSQRERGPKGKAFTTHEVTRRFKRYARKAGLKSVSVSLRTLANTHKELIRLYGDADQLAEALGIYTGLQPHSAFLQIRHSVENMGRRHGEGKDGRLHGIGRSNRPVAIG